MKKFTRFLSAIIAVVLAVTMLIPLGALAAVPKEKLDSMGFEAYRVLDRDPSTIPTDNEKDTNKVYTVNKDFKNFFAGINPDAYNAGIRNGEIWITVGTDGNLRIVPNTEEVPAENLIILPVNDAVTANSADVLAGVLLSEIESSNARASDAQRLAGWLKNYVENETITPVSVTVNEDGKVYIGDLEYGYWLVYSTKKVSGVSNVKVVLEVGEKSQETINVKAEYDGLDKTVRNLTDGDDTYEKNAQADAGDILAYKVEFDIQPLDDYPAIDGSSYTDFKYNFTDTLTNQRLVNYLNTSTTVEGTTEKQGAFFIKVDVNGSTRYYVDRDTNAITDSFKRSLGLSTSADVQPLTNIRKTEEGAINYGTYTGKKQTFSIEFNWGSLKTLVSTHGAHVTFMYKAELTSDAVLKNNNQVTLEYSTNPNNQEDYTTNTDTTTVYSYGLDITKTFAGLAGNSDLWKDVTFNLFEASLPSGKAPDDLVESKKIAFVGTEGDYKRADSNSTDGSCDLKLKKDGNTLNIYGLDPGYYVLEETSSPNGYLLGGKVYIYISESGNVLSAANSALWLGLGEENDISAGITTVTSETKDSLKFTIDNQKRDFDLPTTGDMGVWLFGIGGVLMLACAAFTYSTLKKKREE